MTGLEQVFDAAMARLGPYGAAPRLAVAVSGGADSTALALLAQGWAARRGGGVLALIVDHGLRDESGAEAQATALRLGQSGIASRILRLEGLSGSAIQAKARAARHEILARAALAEGCLHLLFGHHAGDQAETVAMRAARGPQGGEGIAAWSARNRLVLLRPLLGVPPEALRAYLVERGMEWVEDPSNAALKFERVRIRQAGLGMPADPAPRQTRDWQAAEFLARFVRLAPEGFAVVDASVVPTAALAALLRVIGGRDYAPAQPAIAALGAGLRPATLGGVRILAAGRLGPGWLLLREPASVAPPVPAHRGARWDNRFVLECEAGPGVGLGALGADVKKFKNYHGFPTAVLRTMPCLREGGAVQGFPVAARFSPPAPAAAHPFWG